MFSILQIFTLILIISTVSADIMDRHSKIFGECLMMLEKNFMDGTLSANLTGARAMEEICDEFAAHIVSWV